MAGIFTISLDFELHWGMFDVVDRQSREVCYRNTLQMIPQMLELFAEYDVHVTWATVGSLFAKDQQEWEQLKPSVEPDYVCEKHSAYKWVERNSLEEKYHWAHFAPEAIETILKYPGQEVGSHTFSHYYCLAPQRSQEAFVEDLKSMKRAAAKFGIQPVSLVFPRNQFNSDYLKTCYKAGIRAVRCNSHSWYYKLNSNISHRVIKKIFRTANDYLPISNEISYPLDIIEINPGEPLQIPRGRLFTPWKPYKYFNNILKLHRIAKELEMAAIRKECYHLWWHPEEFGDYPEENLARLRILLQQYKVCKNRYGMESWNMSEYAQHLLD